MVITELRGNQSRWQTANHRDNPSRTYDGGRRTDIEKLGHQIAGHFYNATLVEECQPAGEPVNVNPGDGDGFLIRIIFNDEVAAGGAEEKVIIGYEDELHRHDT